MTHECASGPNAKQVKLLDGTEVCNCSREWLQECNARQAEAERLLSLPLERRRFSLDKITNPLQRERLQATMTRIFETRKGNKA